MPIKTDYSDNISHLSEFIPYTLGTGVQVVDDVNDMFSYDLMPIDSNAEVVMKYDVGAKDTYETTLSIKNITTNITLQAVIRFNNNVFSIMDSEDASDDSSTLVVRISPSQTKTFIVALRKSRLNSYSNMERLNTTIEVSIKNLSSGEIATKNEASTVLQKRLLPNSIEVV